MTQDKNGDDGGRTLMFNPSEAEEFRKAMEDEKARKSGAEDESSDDSTESAQQESAKTMMFSPGQLDEALKKQTENLKREEKPEEEIQSAKTMAFSADEVASHVNKLKADMKAAENEAEPGTSTEPNLPNPTNTLAYSKDDVEALQKAQGEGKPEEDMGTEEDMGNAQTMMYSVEDSQKLKEAFNMLDKKSADDAAQDEAQELLRQAREQDAAPKGEFQPSNPFSAADAAEPQPKPSDAGEEPTVEAPTGAGPSTAPTMETLTEQALAGAGKRSAGKTIGVIVGVLVAGALIAGLLHAFSVIVLPFDFLPRF